MFIITDFSDRTSLHPQKAIPTERLRYRTPPHPQNSELTSQCLRYRIPTSPKAIALSYPTIFS
ncbi:hypothetical protein IQ226_04590 [Dolichospermum sp. LEGE 00240]|jgi:hypothetical protein|uniref:hypothetical protein n=1 Tax=Dolichospermum sp. LEGE 00240 TaxID=1828603 RepID=UPI00187F1DFA|nr:hypothetical protein [Dolichospermum sp. LEGE 00240]MBE9248479.1 hypothetical protein [Dolichospermum sp. LEGE 00240]MDM3844453.1 hypothetical protein [Aphanizomenon gracile PMC638.10]MDM3851961.1 hypothetical protein [Aphanizomenon gracile PMC627.10]MDM3857266.1 hypothetical protein [Aphanizomenon gracile PMC649.10]